jgi:hypothetical protein
MRRETLRWSTIATASKSQPVRSPPSLVNPLPCSMRTFPSPSARTAPNRWSRAFRGVEGAAQQRLVIKAKGGDHARLQRSLRPGSSSSKTTSRRSGPLPEPFRLQAIRLDERRLRLRPREQRRWRPLKKPLGNGRRIFCAWVYPLARRLRWPSTSRLANPNSPQVLGEWHLDNRDLEETSVGNYSDQRRRRRSFGRTPRTHVTSKDSVWRPRLANRFRA